jgi:hypothetical protein
MGDVRRELRHGHGMSGLMRGKIDLFGLDTVVNMAAAGRPAGRNAHCRGGVRGWASS